MSRCVKINLFLAVVCGYGYGYGFGELWHFRGKLFEAADLKIKVMVC